MKCIILDDEPLAIDVLRDYISRVPFLECGGAFRDPLRALDFLRNHVCDLIFLDVNMPGLTGIQFLRSLARHPLVIFTTAYSQYAVESYEYEAVDYLLKPIEFERFCRAVNKAYEAFLMKSYRAEAQGDEQKSLLVKSGTGFHKIDLDEILFVKGTGNYVTFVTTQRKILSLVTMKQASQMLPPATFLRVHKSFIVNLSHVEIIEKEKIKIGEHFIPVGRIYRSAFFRQIKKA